MLEEWSCLSFCFYFASLIRQNQRKNKHKGKIRWKEKDFFFKERTKEERNKTLPPKKEKWNKTSELKKVETKCW